MLKSTMQDLADAVGVSRITVWKALNDREGVSPRTKKRIQQKAAEMGLTDTEIQMEKIPEKETGRDEAEERTSLCRWSPDLNRRRSGCRSSIISPRSWPGAAST